MTDVVTEATENEAAVTEASDAVSEVDTPAASETVNKLGAFWSSVDAVDRENPNLEPVVAEYDKLDRGDKMKITHALKAKVMDALAEDNFTLGKLLSQVSKAVTASSGGDAGGDPTEELTQRMAGLFIAYNHLNKSNGTLAERVRAAVEEGTKDFQAEKPESISGALAKRLIETKMGRKPREGGGTRHNPGKHIAEVFANLSDGTFLSIKELTEAKSEEYGDDTPSAVSISTHIKNSFDANNGLTAVYDGEKLTGVRKGEAPEA